MGYVVHHSLVVTSHNLELLEEVRAYALQLCGHVTSVAIYATNVGGSFLVGPDGSKEGWESSDEGDSTRKAVKAYITSKQYQDGSNSVKFVELEWPEDDDPTVIDFEKPLPGTEVYSWSHPPQPPSIWDRLLTKDWLE